MTISYIGSTATPSDNASQFMGATAVAKSTATLGAAQAGDLIIFPAADDSGYSVRDIAISEASGQSWNALMLSVENTLQMHKLFWCRFNGTWGADPSTIPAGDGYYEGYTQLLHVFRPTNSGNTWAVDVAIASAPFADPSAPYDVTVPGQSPASSSSVTFALFHGYGLATYSTLTSGWNVCDSAQYRNTATNTMSLAPVYKINTTSGSTGSVVNRMATNHSRGLYSIVTFNEISSAVPSPAPRIAFPQVLLRM